MSWWTAIVEPITSIVKEPLVEWQKRKTLVVEQEDKELERAFQIRVKKIDTATELAKQGIKVEADWDTEAQKQMEHSWKDEWFVILFSIPLIAAFVPQWQEAILKGFETLQKTPEWYIMLVLGIVASTFGLRWLISKGK